MIRHTVSARAALAGNPSDGYQGAVLSVHVPALAATVFECVDSGEEIDLVRATKHRFATDVAALPDCCLEVDTNIPRSVGLAGSSAIVIATLRCCAELARTDLAPDEVAQLAYAVERVDLGIAGGWQDQICQSRPAPLLMNFDHDGHRSAPVVPGRVVPLFIAWSEAASEDSGESHAALRARADDLGDVMSELASLANTAAETLATGDVHTLKETMNATFDLRASCMPIALSHSRMINAAREAGAACNFAGSGGAIVGVTPKATDSFRSAMTTAGYSLLEWDLKPD